MTALILVLDLSVRLNAEGAKSAGITAAQMALVVQYLRALSREEQDIVLGRNATDDDA